MVSAARENAPLLFIEC